MNILRNLLCAALLTVAPLATAGGKQPDEATGKVAGIYVEVASDVYRLATADDARKPGARLWADIRFTRAAAGKARHAFVRLAPDAEFQPERGDLVQVRLARPLHPFAYPLGPMPERDTLLAMRAKYFTEIAILYDREPETLARFQ
jgi:hypothetical protein